MAQTKRRDKAVVSKTMSVVKSSGTAPEIMLRKTLWRMGLRYRLNVNTLPGKPDVVFVKSKVALFVDGDFWHGRQWRLRGYKSLDSQFDGVSNKPYWVEKITRNIARDRKVNAQLRKLGWRVVRVWESDVKRDAQKAAKKVLNLAPGLTKFDRS
ncbi:MAG: very short patch repair endonuclease [Nitrospinae bacterium]|nr:very short patch repair endonuclease [Nitrospinota bacterium]